MYSLYPSSPALLSPRIFVKFLALLGAEKSLKKLPQFAQEANENESTGFGDFFPPFLNTDIWGSDL